MKLKLDFNTYKDKVKACWIGKNIGGTMGTPFEGVREVLDIKGFTTPKNVVLSVIGTYFCGMMFDYFMFGFDLKRKVCIISPKLDVFVEFILHDLHSGATIYENYGAYDGTPRREVVTIVDKSEYRKLMDFIKKTDPKAFVTVYKVNSMQYQPKIKK